MRNINMPDYCQEHGKLCEKVSEMHGDLKVLVSEFKAMNGSLRNTKQNFEEHEKESKKYRHQIDVLWSAINAIKWAIGLVFGTGVFFKLFEVWMR